MIEIMNPFELKEFLKLTIKIYHNSNKNTGIIRILNTSPEKEICYKL